MGYPAEVPDPEPSWVDHIKQHQPSVVHTFTPPPTRFNVAAAAGRRNHYTLGLHREPLVIRNGTVARQRAQSIEASNRTRRRQGEW
jgi:hypothetical protein